VSTPAFHRLRAQRLAQLLDEADGRSGPHAPARPDAQLAGYVQLSDRLRGAAGLLAEPGEEFRAGLRARLMAAAEPEDVGPGAVAPPPGRGAPLVARRIPLVRRRASFVTSRRTGGALLVGLAAGTFALSGVSAVSGDALPGDPLYGVKRSTENARLALAGSDASRGELYLQFARTRLHEARDTGVPRSRGLDEMDGETRDGIRLLLTDAVGRHDSAALDAIDAFVAAQRTELARFGADERVLRSVALLDRIAARSATVRASLGCAPTAAGRADDLGPLAPECPAAGIPGPALSTGGAGHDPAPHPNRPPDGSPISGAATPGAAPYATPYASPSAAPLPTSPSGSVSPSSPSTSPSGVLGHRIHGVI
jgi:Domain of unknown function (DUF5667)